MYYRKKTHAVKMCKRAGKHFIQQNNNSSMGKSKYVYLCYLKNHCVFVLHSYSKQYKISSVYAVEIEAAVKSNFLLHGISDAIN